MNRPVLTAFWGLCLLAGCTHAAAKESDKATERAVPESFNLRRALAERPRVDRPVTLEEAVAVALRESPVVRGAVEEVEVAASRVGAARAERRPWASLNTFVAGGSAANIMGGADPVQPRMLMGLPGGRFFDQNVNVMVPLFTGGRLKAMVRQAQALQAASRAELAMVRQEVALMVRTAYREVQARESQLAVVRATLEQNRERLRVDQIAFEQEKIPRFYLLRDEAEVANTQQMLTSAERDRDLSLLQLKTVMGVHFDSRLELAQPLEFRPASELLSALAGTPTGEGKAPAADEERQLARLMALAGQNRSELAAATQRLAAGEQVVRSARSAFKPQVSAGVMGDWMRMRGESPFGGTTFAVVGSLPILDGGLRKARVEGARSEARKLDEQRLQTALQVGREVREALLNLRTAETNVATAQVGLKAAEEDYRVAQLRYTSGKGINLEALDALAVQVRAQNNRVQALYEYSVARDRLTWSIGLVADPPTR